MSLLYEELVGDNDDKSFIEFNLVFGLKCFMVCNQFNGLIKRNDTTTN